MKKLAILFFMLFQVSAFANSHLNQVDIKQISQVVLQGGSFWEGYFHYSIDVGRKFLEANWDRRTMERMERKNGHKKLTKLEIDEIIQSISALKAIPPVERCGVAADGPEESILLKFGHTQESLRIVNQRSSDFVCGGMYTSNESFEHFLDLLKKFLPNPFEAG